MGVFFRQLAGVGLGFLALILLLYGAMKLFSELTAVKISTFEVVLGLSLSIAGIVFYFVAKRLFEVPISNASLVCKVQDQTGVTRIRICPACQCELSPTDNACPNCVASTEIKSTSNSSPDEWGKLIGGVITLFIVLFFVTTSIYNDVNPPPTTQPQSATPISRTEQISRQFSQYDGAHRNLERLVESVMNNPDSFEHIETTYTDQGDHLVVQMDYRGANAFGGIVRERITAKTSIEGGTCQPHMDSHSIINMLFHTRPQQVSGS